MAESLHARLLPERPGALDRPARWWDAVLDDDPSRRNGQSAYRFALHHDAAGEPDGYLSFRIGQRSGGGWGPGGTVRVVGLDSATPQGYARLWRFVLDLDLVRTFEARGGPDEPLLHLLADVRAVTSTVGDGTYVRLVDLPRALEARRYAAPVDLVLGVRDPLLPQNAGAFRLRATPGRGRGGAGQQHPRRRAGRPRARRAVPGRDVTHDAAPRRAAGRAHAGSGDRAGCGPGATAGAVLPRRLLTPRRLPASWSRPCPFGSGTRQRGSGIASGRTT